MTTPGSPAGNGAGAAMGTVKRREPERVTSATLAMAMPGAGLGPSLGALGRWRAGGSRRAGRRRFAAAVYWHERRLEEARNAGQRADAERQGSQPADLEHQPAVDELREERRRLRELASGRSAGSGVCASSSTKRPPWPARARVSQPSV